MNFIKCTKCGKDLDRWQAGVCAFDIQEHFGVD